MQDTEPDEVVVVEDEVIEEIETVVPESDADVEPPPPPAEPVDMSASEEAMVTDKALASDLALNSMIGTVFGRLSMLQGEVSGMLVMVGDWGNTGADYLPVISELEAAVSKSVADFQSLLDTRLEE